MGEGFGRLDTAVVEATTREIIQFRKCYSEFGEEKRNDFASCLQEVPGPSDEDREKVWTNNLSM